MFPTLSRRSMKVGDDRFGRCVKAPQERMVRFNPMLLSELISRCVPPGMAMQYINVTASIRSRQGTIRGRISPSIWFWYLERLRAVFSNLTSKHTASSEASSSRTPERPPEGHQSESSERRNVGRRGRFRNIHDLSGPTDRVSPPRA